MLSPQESAERLTRVGAGTPMGELLRRYWQPFAFSSDVEAGGRPEPITLLGEDLVLYRDEAGQPGLIGRKCAHRCADLSYGRVEDGGLRCIYHGWLYDREGQCLEQPGEPEGGKRTRNKFRHKAYPCAELADTIWAYMGPGEPPELPNHPALHAPSEYRDLTRWYTKCNFLQGLEGGLDPMHGAFLHKFLERPDYPLEAGFNDFNALDIAKIHMDEMHFGLRYIVEREEGEVAGMLGRFVQIGHLLVPNGLAVNGVDAPLGRGGAALLWHVPIDDTHHWRIEFTFHSKRPLDRDYISRNFDPEFVDGPLSGIPVRNEENRYLQDYEELKTSTYTGLGHCIPVHDLVVVEGQGPIHDHTQEHLFTTDEVLIKSRRMLHEAMDAVEAGKDPLGVYRNKDDKGLSAVVPISDKLDDGQSIEDFCRYLAEGDHYTLEPL